MDTDSFISHIKTEDLYKDIKDDGNGIFITSSFEAERTLSTLPTANNEIVIGVM